MKRPTRRFRILRRLPIVGNRIDARYRREYAAALMKSHPNLGIMLGACLRRFEREMGLKLTTPM